MNTNNFYQCARAARDASQTLTLLDTAHKNQVLQDLAALIRTNAETILAANASDVAEARAAQRDDALLDRLLLTPARLAAIASAVEAIAALPDPVGEERAVAIDNRGLRISKRRVPLGVIFMIYESRPNVTLDAAALGFKSGNAVLLRGGRESRHSNAALAACWRHVLQQHDLPADLVQVWLDCSHEQVREILQWQDCIDVVIPRGGPRLIQEVSAHSRIPVIKHDRGVCHLYVHGDADPNMALRLILDGKCRRPGVCNALEGVLVDACIASDFLPHLAAALQKEGTTVYADPRALPFMPAARAADAEHYGQEYLSNQITVTVVAGPEAAHAYIRQYGSRHTEVICTQNEAVAERFLRAVDASLVLVNASSRFNDGGELGLGAEIGISTSKLHAYGVMGLRELTTEKWLARGNGQIRHG